MTEQVECIVIGAGVVGLAVARALALAGREVIVPVGLLGLAIKTIRVRSVQAARIASTSTTRSRSATLTGTAPTDCAAMG